MKKAEIQQQALSNALSQNSTYNYQAIFNGFSSMGIELVDIKPRENIFTYNAWKAQNRQVRKGEHGVKVSILIPTKKNDKDTGEEITEKRFKNTTVFHISQTDPIDEVVQEFAVSQ